MSKAPAIAAVGLAMGAIALAGCGSDSPPSASSLVGTWEASQIGYGNGTLEGPYRSYFDIQKADDASNSFTGFRRVAPADAAKYGVPAARMRIDGVITPWGDISIVHSDGTWSVSVQGDQLVGRYLEDGSDLAAKSLTLTRK
ncbi:MAG: hypothetical protein ACKOGE_04355 [Actinomycetota bacterium]